MKWCLLSDPSFVPILLILRKHRTILFLLLFCFIAFPLPGLKTSFCLSSHLTASFNFPHLILFLISPLCWGRELYPDTLCAINFYTILNNLSILLIVFTSDQYTLLLAKDKWFYICQNWCGTGKKIMNWNGNIISSKCLPVLCVVLSLCLAFQIQKMLFLLINFKLKYM